LIENYKKQSCHGTIELRGSALTGRGRGQAGLLVLCKMLHRNELFSDTESDIQKLENHNQLMKLGGGGTCHMF
jgi:hypothetical protein